MPELTLTGCTPEPLMNYLKALGVLRLVSEQADPEARGCWRNDMFVLRSHLDEGALVEFFLCQYKPTPIVAPWGARSGFYAGSSEKTAREALEEIMGSADQRFLPFQDLVNRVRKLLKGMGISEKAKDEDKLKLLAACRADLPDEILSWLDACYVLLGDERRFPPLLGTGGNEGSGSYVSGFAQQVVSCLIKRKHDDALRNSLFAVPQKDAFVSQTPGHFSGTAAGGVNASQGFERDVMTNPWDYLLCLEGSCLWASSVVRRMAQSGPRMASFPFTVNVSGVGAGSLGSFDGVKPKNAKRDVAELWLPIWPRFVGLAELRSLLSEGRATVGSRMATTGLDMARAVAELGVDRGIAQFKRNIFLMRNGQNFLAVPAGTIAVNQRERVDLIREIDDWLAGFSRACSGQNVPPRFSAALRGIEQAIFDFCRYGGPTFFQGILRALGRAERELARGGQFREKQEPRPIAGLSPDWIDAANDGSPEFEIALALAGIDDPERKIGSLRSNLEPVEFRDRDSGKLTAHWAKTDRAVVWNSASLPVNLARILERRIMDGSRKGCENLPLAAQNFVSFDTVSWFLAGELDDGRVEDLLWGLVLVEQNQNFGAHQKTGVNAPPLPRAYALLKLLFLPEPLEVNGESIHIRPQPEIIDLVSAGRIGEACRIAMRRLRASELSPLPHRRSGGTARDAEWQELDRLKTDGQRLAAALLLPLDRSAVRTLRDLVLSQAGLKSEFESWEETSYAR